jgi:glycosyltransferase involved in cell wall biosynthesis
MNITVILCTFNRHQSLSKALESVAAQSLSPAINWEVVVVDNNSTDQTRQVVEGFMDRFPGRVRYLFEHRPGKSNALNSGIRQARGQILAFMDDDVVVEPSWLSCLTANLQSGEWAGAGGRILPERSFTPPPWLSREGRYSLAPLALFDLGLQAGALEEAPFGTNMAFRREVFERYGEFRTDLGPRPGSEIRNEDTEFGERVLAKGERLRYEPSAIVYHAVPEKRLSKEYFLKWWFDKARADLREFGLPSDTRWYIAGVPLFMFRRLANWTVRWVTSFQPAKRFACKIKVWTSLGGILESRRLAQARRASGPGN